MASVKSLTAELELRSDDRGRWSVWFKGERIPGVVKINGNWENGTRAEVTLTFVGAAVALSTDIPSGVYYHPQYETLVDADGEAVAFSARFLSRFAEFPVYVPKIPDHMFYVPELHRFFDIETFELMADDVNQRWYDRRDEFPQKFLTDAIEQTYSGTDHPITVDPKCVIDLENGTMTIKP